MGLFARSVMSVVVTAALAAPALAQGALPDASRGRQIAERNCASCHVTGPTATGTAVPAVPPFSVIAKLPEQSAERLAGKIIIPHPLMPTLNLTMSEIRDLTTYIMSLR